MRLDDEKDFCATWDEADGTVVLEFKEGAHGWGQTTGGRSLELYQIGFYPSEILELISALQSALPKPTPITEGEK